MTEKALRSVINEKGLPRLLAVSSSFIAHRSLHKSQINQAQDHRSLNASSSLGVYVL